MKTMTSHERFRRMFAHQDADRIPIIDSPWDATIERWQQRRHAGRDAAMSITSTWTTLSRAAYR